MGLSAPRSIRRWLISALCKAKVELRTANFALLCFQGNSKSKSHYGNGLDWVEKCVLQTGHCVQSAQHGHGSEFCVSSFLKMRSRQGVPQMS